MSNPSRCPRIVITPGEPAGVGPDLTVQIAQRTAGAELVVIADPELLVRRAEQLGVPLEITPFDARRPPLPHQPGRVCVLKVETAISSECGKPDSRNAPYVVETLRTACQGCLNGLFDAMVTAPVHKASINDAGIPFTGHTEFLAKQTGTQVPVMMLCAKGLRVALATTHMPLARVSAAITRDHLQAVIRVLCHDLRQCFAIANPRVLICALNPHAGEGRYLGHEETDVIVPVLEELCAEGLQLIGPVPADTAFTPGRLEGTDAVLAMYHDQGLPVLKHRGFGEAVNITLGLPIIRTSVDHGVALELAGTGKAHSGSLEAAIEMAISIASLKESVRVPEHPGHDVSVSAGSR
ncbi:MAG: 4-hydroxythreonine-4-phosphate dehydrogenase PdxA [Gammaproteobacteria bacterium]|nr:4-hydroxythreonine-4-phosphate dehydrogenase PdxA [Gammaproteobacteria bacterium]